MNEESIELWLALLKEWLEIINCTSITKYSKGFHVIYRKMKIWLDLCTTHEKIDIRVTRYRNIDIARYNVRSDMPLSEFDICDPNITPAVRFKALKSHFNRLLDLSKARIKYAHDNEN